MQPPTLEVEAQIGRNNPNIKTLTNNNNIRDIQSNEISSSTPSINIIKIFTYANIHEIDKVAIIRGNKSHEINVKQYKCQ